MHRRYSLAHLILASVVVLGLTPLMVSAAPQAQIAFSSERDGNWEIYVMDADGENQRRLTNNRRDDRDPSWSPDGQRIAFTSSGKVVNVNVVGVHPPPVVGEPPQIYVMDADGKNQQRLTNNDFAEWEPSWSPDGKRIAFTSSGAMDTWGWHIYVVDADGKNQHILTNNDFHDWYPSWSPDGKRIAFISWRDEKGYDIYVMDADGGNQQRLTRNASPDTDPSWSPDGQRIVFVSHRDGNKEIYVMNADGARQARRRTKDGSDDTDPAWFDPAFVPVFAVSPAGKKFTMWGWFKQVDR